MRSERLLPRAARARCDMLDIFVDGSEPATLLRRSCGQLMLVLGDAEAGEEVFTLYGSERELRDVLSRMLATLDRE